MLIWRVSGGVFRDGYRARFGDQPREPSDDSRRRRDDGLADRHDQATDRERIARLQRGGHARVQLSVVQLRAVGAAEIQYPAAAVTRLDASVMT